MRIFVTGATGWIGRGLVPDLLAAGHDVVGLARSDASASALRHAGASVLLGSLEQLDRLKEGAAESDGVIHLAFRHDIAFAGDYAGATRSDREAIEALGQALRGTAKPLVIASGILGVLGLPPGQIATERDGLATSAGEGVAERIGNAHRALSFANDGVRSSVVRRWLKPLARRSSR